MAAVVALAMVNNRLSASIERLDHGARMAKPIPVAPFHMDRPSRSAALIERLLRAADVICLTLLAAIMATTVCTLDQRRIAAPIRSNKAPIVTPAERRIFPGSRIRAKL